MRQPTLVWPGPARLTLVLLAVVPAVLAYPWPSTRDRWVLGVAAAVLIVLLPWWRGLHLTTILRRRLAMLRRGTPRGGESGIDARSTAVLRVTPSADADALPLALLAGYLDRYGIRADAIRVTSRDTAAGRDTWVGMTLSAAANLAALQARSPRIPLEETTEIAVRRLADHLRELGWQVSGATADDIPELVTPSARESWRGVRDGDTGHVAAYRINPGAALSDTLTAIWSQPEPETWTAVEIAETATGRTLAAACAFRSDAEPGGTPPLPGLLPQHGTHRSALSALNPLSVRRLDGPAVATDLLAQLCWPTGTLSRT